MSTPRKVNFPATISWSVWIMIKRVLVKLKSSVTVCPECKYFGLYWLLVWLQCCSITASAIFRVGEQEECLFLVFPSPQKILGTLDEGKKRSNPKLVCQLQLSVSVHFLTHFVEGVVQPLQLQYTSLTVFYLLKQHRVIKPLKWNEDVACLLLSYG